MSLCESPLRSAWATEKRVARLLTVVAKEGRVVCTAGWKKLSGCFLLKPLFRSKLRFEDAPFKVAVRGTVVAMELVEG